MSPERTKQQPIDLLAAVVLHVLVSEGRAGLSVEQVAKVCERDPANPDEHDETRRALDVLVADDLAIKDGERFKPTRAACRADELSF